MQHSSLPFNSLLWLDEGRMVCAGYDCRPVLLQGSVSSGWSIGYALDEKKTTSNRRESTQSAAMNVFRQMDSRAVVAGKTDIGLTTFHQNTIT